MTAGGRALLSGGWCWQDARLGADAGTERQVGAKRQRQQQGRAEANCSLRSIDRSALCVISTAPYIPVDLLPLLLGTQRALPLRRPAALCQRLRAQSASAAIASPLASPLASPPFLRVFSPSSPHPSLAVCMLFGRAMGLRRLALAVCAALCLCCAAAAKHLHHAPPLSDRPILFIQGARG